VALGPRQVLNEAIKAVPAVIYALGVLGVAAAVAVMAGFQLGASVAVFGTIIMMGLMVVLLVFARLASTPDPVLRGPGVFMAWAFVLLITGTAGLLLSTTFFKWLVSWQSIVGARRAAPGTAQSPTAPFLLETEPCLSWRE